MSLTNNQLCVYKTEFRRDQSQPPTPRRIGADPIHQNFNPIVGLVQITNTRLPHNSHKPP